MTSPTHFYVLALGSNRRHGRHGPPERVVEAAMDELAQRFTLCVRSSVLRNPAMGGAGRSFANAAALIASPLTPTAFLLALKQIERAFGRRPGRRWGPRVLDLDIMAWDGPDMRTSALTIPHPQLGRRAFMLQPFVEILPYWRIFGSITAAHQKFRLAKPKPSP